jgi:uncharacterized protein YjbJ (UPF0337 family)
MNWNQVEGKWKEFRGDIREKWGRLTEDDLDTIAGKRDKLIGKLQQEYGYARERAEQEVEGFLNQVGTGQRAKGAGAQSSSSTRQTKKP